MGIKLLIADDEEVICKGVAKYLRLHTDRFSKIYEAENGQEALDIIIQKQPDMMILDVQMPILSGIDVMREASKAGIKPITIILSGYDEFSYAQKALKFGAKEYLLKPVRAADILTLLNELADEYIGREIQTIDDDSSEETEKDKENPLVKEAKEYIRENYACDLALSDVADHLQISVGYLSTLMNQCLQCGFTDYLNQIRIDRACCYLEQNVLKNYEIAYKVGFNDEKYFSKVFKKIKGMSPKEYRMQAR